MTVRRTETEWAEIISEYMSSGQTAESWCKEHGVNKKTLWEKMRKAGKRRRVSNGGARGEKEWLALIAEQQESGVNRSRWCREKGISASAMDSAVKRIKDRDALQEKRAAKQEWVEIGVNAGGGEGAAEGNKGGKRADVRKGAAYTEGVQTAPTVHAGDETESAAQASESVSMPNRARKAGRLRAAQAAVGAAAAVARGKVRVVVGGCNVEMEADGGYPAEKLANLIERLVKRC